MVEISVIEPTVEGGFLRYRPDPCDLALHYLSLDGVLRFTVEPYWEIVERETP